MAISKEELKDIFYDTLEQASEISPYFTDSIKIILDRLELTNLDDYENYEVEITVVNKDIIRTILDTSYDWCLVLNLASYKNPGGGVYYGSMAQEEEISRKTDYMKHNCEGLYPMKLNEIIFTSNIKVLKDENYNRIHRSLIKQFDMIAVAALRNPQLTSNQKFYTNDREITFKKIEGIFKFAIIHGYKILILGALGCGAYHNPPQEIIDIFNECILLYGKKFKKIIFSVYSTRDNNYELFNQYILRL